MWFVIVELLMWFVILEMLMWLVIVELFMWLVIVIVYVFCHCGFLCADHKPHKQNLQSQTT
jgi:hypothetical protein